MLRRTLGAVPRAVRGRGRQFSSKSGRVLLTGACGQVGQELVPHLRQIYGTESVIATDVREAPAALMESGPFMTLDVTDGAALETIVKDHDVGTIVHLADPVNHASVEQDPLCQRCLPSVNMSRNPDIPCPLKRIRPVRAVRTLRHLGS